MQGFTAPLYFSQPCSMLCRNFSVILHGFACAVCIVQALKAPIFLVTLAMLIASFLSSEACFRKSRVQLVSILLRANDDWLIMCRDHVAKQATMTRGAFYSKKLIIIFLKDLDGESWMVLLAPDNTSQEQRRRLYVRLRFPVSPS